MTTRPVSNLTRTNFARPGSSDSDRGPRSSNHLGAILATGLLLAALVLVGCYAKPTATPSATAERPVTAIPLAGPAAGQDAEISGLAWYGDYLILLPQYPDRMGDNLFALPKSDILTFLDGDSSEPLTPLEIPLAGTPADLVRGYEGLEAITFAGDRVLITIEAEDQDWRMGYLVGGRIAADLSGIRLETDTLVEIQPQADLENFSDEALLVVDDVLLTFYEANGANVNPAPVAHRFDLSLNSAPPVTFPNIEYRITDSSAPDAEGRFWVINYLYPGDLDKLDPLTPDPLTAQYGAGETHSHNVTVERLLECQYSDSGITLVTAPPLQLELLGDDSPRNWEGLVRLDERGFLLATDKYPETILAFVPLP